MKCALSVIMLYISRASADEPTLLEEPSIKEIAAVHKKSPAQVCLFIRWWTKMGWP